MTPREARRQIAEADPLDAHCVEAHARVGGAQDGELGVSPVLPGRGPAE